MATTNQELPLEERVLKLASQVISQRPADHGGAATIIDIEGRIYDIFHTGVNQFVFRKDTDTVIYQGWFYDPIPLNTDASWGKSADTGQLQQFLADGPRILAFLSRGRRGTQGYSIS